MKKQTVDFKVLTSPCFPDNVESNNPPVTKIERTTEARTPINSPVFSVSKVSSEIQEPGCSPYKQRRLPIFYLQVNTNPCGNTEEKLSTTIQRKT